MNFTQMRKRCPGAKLLGAARLPGYRLGFTFFSPGFNCGTADILANPAGEVWGVLYSLSRGDLAALDAFEGHPEAYRRRRVTVDLEGAPLAGVLCYEVAEKAGFVKPSSAYLGVMLRAAASYGFPAGYRTELARIGRKG